MAEKIISPGVFTKEIDQSFLPAAVGEIGAAIVGPTVKGPALIPTTINSFDEYDATFGTTFTSGSSKYQYLTSLTAQHYLKNSDSLTVVRIMPDNYTAATASVYTDGDLTSAAYSTGSLIMCGSNKLFVGSTIELGNTSFICVAGPASTYPQTATTMFYQSQSGDITETAHGLAACFNSSSIHGMQISASVKRSTQRIAGTANAVAEVALSSSQKTSGVNLSGSAGTGS